MWAKTAGFTDHSLTVEAVAARWNEVMAGSAENLSPTAPHDPRQWDIKPYRAETGGRAT